MTQPKEGSRLIHAVQAFDEELERFARAAASACRRSLDSKRELERAAESVREAGDAEKAMQARAQELLAALKAAQADQQARAEALNARTQDIEGRFAVYGALADRYQQLGAEGAELAEAAQKLGSGPDGQPTSKPDLLAGMGDLERRVSALRATARSLSTDAREAHFEDIADKAHDVDQTLSSLRNKLLLAQKAAGLAAPGE